MFEKKIIYFIIKMYRKDNHYRNIRIAINVMNDIDQADNYARDSSLICDYVTIENNQTKEIIFYKKGRIV